MAVTIACTHCGKTFHVHASTTGKKVRCKGCSKVFVASLLESEGTSDIYAGLTDAAQVEQRASGHAAVADMSAYAAPVAPVAPAAPYGGAPGAPVGVRVVADDPPCPGCKAPLPLINRVCTHCGYDRRTGKKAQAIVEREQAMRQRAEQAQRSRLVDRVEKDDYDYRGVRQNSPYRNGFVNFLDAAGTEAAIWLYAIVWILGFAGNIRAAANHPERPGAAISLTIVIQLVQLGLLIGVFIPVVVKGMDYAGRIMKFELPEQPGKRLIAVWVSTFIGLLPLFFIAALSLGAAALSGAGGRPSAGAVLSVLGGFMVVIALGGIGLSYLSMWFFYRLRFLESVVAYIFFVLFHILGALAMFAVAFLIGAVFAIIFGGV